MENEIKELTFKTANNKRVFVYTGHTETEYFEKYGEEFGAEELNFYTPFEVLRGECDDETKPSQRKKYWCLDISGEKYWYEIPEEE